MPVSLLLMKESATVTVCHSRSKDIPSIVRNAEILIVAVGVPLLVKKEWIKPGAVVIDVGINQYADKSKKSGFRLVGDVDYDNVKEVCSKITPVPGGVGPMTNTMLLKNTYDSALKSFNSRQ